MLIMRRLHKLEVTGFRPTICLLAPTSRKANQGSKEQSTRRVLCSIGMKREALLRLVF